MSERRISGNLGFTSADVSLIGAESCLVHTSYGVIRVFETTTGGLKLSSSHQARVPAGASAANVKKQKVVGSNAVTTRDPVYGIPRYYYSDINATCASCAKPFVFTQNEQHVWFEDHGMPVYLLPTRCAACRDEHGRGEAVRLAIETRKKDSKNQALVVEEARQRILQHECTGDTDLAKPLALLRGVEEKSTDPAIRGDAFRWLAALEDLRGKPKDAVKYHRLHLEAHAGAPCPACAEATALLAK